MGKTLFLLTVLAALGTGAMKDRPASACVWQRCGLHEGKLVNCENEERGTALELASVVEATTAGSVKWSCAPGARGLHKDDLTGALPHSER